MKNKLLLLAVVVIVGALLYYCFNIGSKSEDVSAAAGETYKLEYTPTLQAYGFTEPVILKAKASASRIFSAYSGFGTA